MPLVEVSHLVKHFTRGGSLLRHGTDVHAVDDVSFAIDEGETFGLVGESGSGKTTTGRCLLRLIEPTSGEVRFRGEDVLAFPRKRMRDARREMQIVFQDPYSSLNPRMRARDKSSRSRSSSIVWGREPSAGRAWRNSSASSASTRRISSATRTSSAAASASGSVSPARWRCTPSFVVLDEPVSALDVSVQAQVVNLLMDLQQQLKLTYLFIAHDLRLVEHICSRVAVMYLGKIVEMGPTAALFAAPQHPYTRALLSAIPVPDPDAPRQRIVLDPALVDRDAALKEIVAGHWAAI